MMDLTEALVAHVAEEVFRVLPVGDHRGRSPEDTLLVPQPGSGEDVFHMDQKCDGQHNGAQLVKEENGSEAANRRCEFARPEALAEADGQPRRGQSQKGGEQRGMHIPLFRRKAHVKARRLRACMRLRVCMGLRSCLRLRSWMIDLRRLCRVDFLLLRHFCLHCHSAA